MNSIKCLAGRGTNLLVAFAFVAAAVAPAVLSQSVYAGQFSPRKLTQSSQSPGTQSTDANGNTIADLAGTNGLRTRNTFNFTVATASNLGSIAFQYCTTPLIGTACTLPTGLNTAGITSIVTQTGFTTSDWTIDTTTAGNTGAFATSQCTGAGAVKRDNCILIKRSGASSAVTGPITLTFGVSGTNTITNPTNPGSFYVRMISFSDTAFTTSVDDGATAGSVNPTIDITAKVQEVLNFSVSGVYSVPGTGCSALSGSGALTLGASGVLDTSTGYDAYSYFRLNTNANNGTSVFYSGDTLKKVDNTTAIAPVSSTVLTASTPGTEQFGLGFDTGATGYSRVNLTLNTSPNYNGTATTGTLVSGTPRFLYDATSLTTPVLLATAAATTVSCDTLVVRHVANISTTTRPGIYKTSIAYIAVATF